VVLESLAGWDLVLFWGLFGLFMITGGVICFIWLYRARWNFIWVLIQDGKIVKRGRCRLISFGDGGEEIFFLKGINKWKVAYGKRIGTNQIAWGLGKDGYWYNIELGNVDTALLEIGVNPVDRDMRYATASVRKGIENRYTDKSFMEKWGTSITIILIILAISAQGVSSYFTLKKQGEINVQTSTANLEAVKTSERVMGLSADILGKVDNIVARQAEGSGMATALSGS
jgi:hypothetical protein